MIDSTVDGYHTKCGKWHNVGDCPLDDDTKRPKPRTSWQQETKTSKKKEYQKSTNLSISQQKRSTLYRIKTVKSNIKKYEEQKVQLESKIPDCNVSVLPLVVVCCVVVLIIASYVGTNINSNAGFISIGVGFLVSDGIVEHYNERLSAKRKKQIESKYADLINAKDEKERLIINCREMLQELCSQYDALSRRQRSWWAGLSGWSFEREVAKVFQLNGYDARVTKGSNDGGIDINLYKNAKRIIVQCKNYKAAVGPAPVRDLFGVLTSVRAHGAIMVSRTSYTKGAVQFADKHGIKLMVLDDVIKMYENVG